MDLKEFIEQLPSIIMYIVPGAGFLLCYKLSAHNRQKLELVSVSTIVMSYVMKLISDQIWIWINSIPIIASYHWGKITDLFIILASAFLGLFLGMLINSKPVDKILQVFLHRRLDDSVWYGISNPKDGCFIDVYLKDHDIRENPIHGAFVDHYSDENDGTWLVVNIQEKLNEQDDKTITKKIAINSQNIDHAIVWDGLKQDSHIKIVLIKVVNGIKNSFDKIKTHML